MTKKIHVLAPAKINRFLHITGQRPDGYHLLQTVFQLINLCDQISLSSTNNGEITRIIGAQSVVADDDLAVKAAKLLQKNY
jgi:4-diphosphocytidyl-2-C-methyl-D-erythritol kinase